MMSNFTTFNPEIMVWARETAGLTLQEAASKIQVTEQKLKKVEEGNTPPTRPMLRKMAHHYRRSLVTFYLENIPIASNYGADFRGLSDRPAGKDIAMISAVLRSAKASQEMIRAIIELEEESTPISFVGWLRRKWNLAKDVDSLELEFQQMKKDQYAVLTQEALDMLNVILADQCTRENYYDQRNAKEAFELLRSSCERSGIFIVLKNNLGNHQSKLW